MHPAVSMICAVAARACLAMCLHASSSHHNNCICLFHWSLWITALDGSLLWSPYLQFACSIDLCGLLLLLPIMPNQCLALPTPHRKWLMVGNRFLHWTSFNVMVLVGGHLQGKLSLTGLPWNVPAMPGNCVCGGGGAPTFDGSQFSSSSIGNEFNFQVNLVWHSRSCLVITTIIAMNGSKIHSTNLYLDQFLY